CARSYDYGYFDFW
nr:immunoglobulin heavy chain junction region [Mus musculus]